MVTLSERSRRPLRFLAVGVANTLIDIGLLFGLTALGVPVLLANTISTGVALAFSFVANRSYTFRAGPGVVGQAVRFLIVTLIGLWVLQPLVIGALLPLLSAHLPEPVALLAAKIAATVVSLTWNYLLYRSVVFADDRKKDETPE